MCLLLILHIHYNTMALSFLQDQPFVIALLILFGFLLFLHRNKPKTYLPPSPPKLPFIGNLHQLGTLPHRSLHVLAQKYGPLMLLHMGRTPTIVVSSAEMAQEIIKTHDVIFSNRPITTATKAFIFGCRDVAFAPYGEYWRQMRKICVIDLLSVRRVRSYKFVREEEIGNMVNMLNKASEIAKPVNLSQIVVTLMNNIISRISLGKKLEGEAVLALIKELMDLFGLFSVEDMFPSLRWIDVVTGLDKRMKKTSRDFHEFLDEVIQDHRLRERNDEEDDDKKDFVDIMLDCQKDLSLGFSLSDNDLKAIIMDMFVGGTDATFATVEWAMVELVKHPEIMKKVQEEIRSVVGKNPIVDEDDINQMEYLNCVIKETLRLHPPLVLSLPRISTAPSEIGSYSIPTRTRVIINVWAIARDPRYWEIPNEFIPDRFINKPTDFKGFDYSFIPFGSGRRSCPGLAFGLASVESVLANLLYGFDWELPVGANKDKIDVESFGLGVHLKNPLSLVPIFRY